MNETIGKVIEVYIPKEYKNNKMIDIVDSKKIGFKIQIDDEIIQIEQEQNEVNSNIFRDDFVIITTQIISNKEFIDIEKYYGDENE